MNHTENSDATLADIGGEPFQGSGFESELPEFDSNAETPSTEEHDQ